MAATARHSPRLTPVTHTTLPPARLVWAGLAGPASCLLPAASHLPPPALRCALSKWFTLPGVTMEDSKEVLKNAGA